MLQKNSFTKTVLLYSFLKLLLFIWVLYLLKTFYFCSLLLISLQGGVDCVGYMAVYRIEFGAVMFFLLMAIIMLGVKNSNDPRASIQNGFWGLKFLIMIGIIIGAFFIPTKDGTFIQGMQVFLSYCYKELTFNFIYLHNFHVSNVKEKIY